MRNFSNPGSHWQRNIMEARTGVECAAMYESRETAAFTRDFIRAMRIVAVGFCCGAAGFGIVVTVARALS